MSNHTHLVLHVNTEKANNWSIREVLEHWHLLHKGTQFTEKYLENKTMAEFELASVYESCENIVNVFVTSAGLCESSMSPSLESLL